MSHEPIQIQPRCEGRVTEIVLGPPPGNLVTAALVEALSAEVRRHMRDAATRHVKAIVIRGDGRHFSFGASVQEHRPDTMRDVLPAFHRFIAELLACPVPTVAGISGLCLGGGFEIAMACSLLVAEEDARCGLPEIRLGVFPPVASVLLPLRMPEAAACRMVLSGAYVSATDLYRLGLVSRLAPVGGLVDAVDDMIAHDLLPSSATALRFANTAVRERLMRAFTERIPEAERLYMETVMHTRDAIEGTEAFLAKRPPVWEDR